MNSQKNTFTQSESIYCTTNYLSTMTIKDYKSIALKNLIIKIISISFKVLLFAVTISLIKFLT